MDNMKYISLLFLLLITGATSAQLAFPVSDSAAVITGGLKFGYSIITEKEKEVGNKGNFSRFSLEFFVVNVSAEAKIIMYKQGFNLLGSDVSPDLVKFKCVNATGARLTSKELTLQAKPCIIQAVVEDKDAAGKAIENKRLVKIGYWIKPGETISARTIVIVPFNEKPGVIATLFPNPNTPVGSTVTNTGMGDPPPLNIQGFVKIKNATSGTYMNNESGLLGCTMINSEWWSAQWQLIPVNGTNYFTIQNRWKNNFLSLDNSGMLSTNNQSVNTEWLLETIDGGNTYTIKNAARNAAIINQNGTIQAAPLFAGQQNTKWIIEQ
jgi:hypothetical protein